MEYLFKRDGESHTVRVVERGDGFEVQVGERRYGVRVEALDATTLALWVDGAFHRVRHAAQGAERWLTVDGDPFHATRMARRRRAQQGGDASGTLAATMPGQIVAVRVQEGEQVERGQVLVLMEAMKMELRVVAPQGGRVGRVLVAEGDAVERGQTLVTLEADPPG